MSEDINRFDEEFDQLETERRHEELKDALATIANAIEEDKTVKIVESLNNQSAELKKLILAVKESSTNENSSQKPQIFVENVVSLLKENIEILNNTISNLNKPESKKEWVFNVIRDSQGLITSINAINK